MLYPGIGSDVALRELETDAMNETGDLQTGSGVEVLLRSLSRTATIETSTRNVADIHEYGRWIEPGTEVFVAWVPGMPYRHLISISRLLRREGFVPVPHVVARRLASDVQARDLFAGLRAEADVDRVLLVGGDDAQSAGPFATTLSILQSGIPGNGGIRRVFLGGFPEGHPHVGEDVVKASLDARMAWAADTGMELSLVSQFCFDGDAMYRWISALRLRGVSLPVRIGLAGPATLRALLRYAALCGIGASARMLRGRELALTRLAIEEGPEQVAHRFASLQATIPVEGGDGFHLFSFGGVEAPARWRRSMAEGLFQYEVGSLRIAS